MPLPYSTESLNQHAARSRVHAEWFTLPLKDRNWRGSSGDYAGSGVGSSLDFQDHRSYVPGDDPRHINWQAYARTGNYSLKLYREEVRPFIEILFDVSASMFADPDKAARALELFYFAFASGEKSGASTSAILIKGDHWRLVGSDEVFSHKWQEIAIQLPGIQSSASPRLFSLPLRARSLRVLISDLLYPASPEPLLQSLTQNSGRAVILSPFAASEAEPDWSGNYDFIDTESGDRNERRVDTSTLKRYKTAYRNHFSQWNTASIRNRAALARVPSSVPFEVAMKHEAIFSGAINLA